MVITDPSTAAPFLLQSVSESFEPDPLVGNKVLSGVQAGARRKTIPCNAYFPKDFSSMYPGYLNVINGSFGIDTMVDVSVVSRVSPKTN